MIIITDIRKLEENDFDDVIEWRSDPTTMRMSKYTGDITEEGFTPVFNRYLTEGCSFIVVGENKEKICIITLHLLLLGQYEIGINMNPDYRGKGLSKSILQIFLKDVSKMVPGISSIIAVIKEQNLPSINLFSNSNFYQVTSIEPGYLKYIYIVP
ncbi:MAG: GNAT family N-acetyltransferase [Candidatus Paceibacterota bacterium]